MVILFLILCLNSVLKYGVLWGKKDYFVFFVFVYRKGIGGGVLFRDGGFRNLGMIILFFIEIELIYNIIIF